MKSKEMKKEPIDLNLWNRAEVYYIFKTFEIPYTNLCTDIDITNFMKHIRTHNYSFFAALLYYLVKTANTIKEFRCRLENDMPVIWNQIGANYTLMQDTKLMGNNYTDFSDDYSEFYHNVLEDLSTAKKSGRMVNKLLPENAFIIVTSIPWTKLTSFTQAIHKVGDAVPYVGIGRRYGQGERIMLPVSMQTHHAFVDGFHIAHYFNLLEMMLNDPEKYMDDHIPYSELLESSEPFLLSEKDKPINF